MQTSLGIWAFGTMATRFVPGGYKPELAGETTVQRVRRAVDGLGLTDLEMDQTVAVLIGFAGIVVIYSDDLRALGGAQVRTVSLVFLLSPIVSAAATVAVKRWGAGLHPLSLTAVPMLLTGVVVGALALAFERRAELTFDARSLAARWSSISATSRSSRPR